MKNISFFVICVLVSFLALGCEIPKVEGAICHQDLKLLKCRKDKCQELCDNYVGIPNGAYKISIHRNCKFQAIKQRTRLLFNYAFCLKDAQNGYGFEKVDSVYGSTFPMVYPDPVRIVTVGRKVENLLADPENKEWLSITVELCKGLYLFHLSDFKAIKSEVATC
ncbi:alanine--tRNA ligase [Artemisia annua]|uniref:Alanine--tRNA ligase n=1 Tax=Artemisia annua TaxID=35608 RepID=A0A2U1NQE1_ARTAN|nr:alanine--tRNA ligase [Artemisia annua]